MRPSTTFSVIGLLVVVLAPCAQSYRQHASRLHQDLEAEARVNRTSASGSKDPCSIANPYFNAKGAKDTCQKCMTRSHIRATCKWCPLSQTCVTSGWWGGNSCEGREGHPEDDKVKSESDCGKHNPPWMEVMNDAYGESWHLNRKKHLDAIRCVQWGLGWPVEADPSHESGSTADEVGRWGCVSALLRDGLLASLGVGENELPTDDSSFLQMQTDSNTTAGRPWWYHERKTWRPAICSIIRKKLADEEDTCYVRAWQLDAFKRLVEISNQKEENLLEKLKASLEAGPMVPLKPGAGKSGSGFGTLADGQYKVKLGLKYKNSMNEPENLMKLVKDSKGNEHLLKHFTDHPESLLSRIFGMIKIAFGTMRSYSVLMEDAFYRLDAVAQKELNGGEAISFTRYDLKGASRNQKEMKKTGFCLVNGDFKEREDARMKLKSDQCLTMRSAVAADTSMLQAHNLIDYSLLLLSVKKKPEDISGVNLKLPENKSLTCNVTAGAPFCMENGDHMYTVSIIDYLNDLNAYKSMESIFIRWGKFWEYGKQVNVYAKKICPTPDELAFKKHLLERVRETGGSRKDAFNEIDVSNSGSISKEELTRYFVELGLSEDEALKIFADLDTDEHGNLNFEEFSYLFD